MATEAETPARDEAPSTGDRSVRAAFALGWHVAELYHADVPSTKDPDGDPPENLPGLSELGDLRRVQLLARQIAADLGEVTAAKSDTAGELLVGIERLLSANEGRVDPKAVRGASLELHREIFESLTVADFRLGKSYGLARALVETSMTLRGSDTIALATAFKPWRIATIDGWLVDLKSQYPDHAAEGVRGSLEKWASSFGAAGGSSTSSDERVTRALHRQGQIWRSLLSGEMVASDLLQTGDYLRAAGAFLKRIRNLTRQVLARYWLPILIALLLVAGIFVLLVAYNLSSTVVAAIVAAAGFFGLTAGSAGLAFRRVLAQVQAPLWEAEIDQAVVQAASRPLEESGRT